MIILMNINHWIRWKNGLNKLSNELRILFSKLLIEKANNHDW
jgi:hypothetical protein